MAEGKIKWFNKTKGFGFIAGDDGVDYFMHHSQVPEDTIPKEEQRVSFEITDTEKGKQAQNVTMLD